MRTLSLLSALVLFGCRVEGDTKTLADHDQDGVNAGDDCDDEDATINPGAAEVEFRLPPEIAAGSWRLLVDTALLVLPDAAATLSLALPLRLLGRASLILERLPCSGAAAS